MMLLDAAPLLEEEGNIGGAALVKDLFNPGGIEWARLGARLTADNDPVDSL